MAVIKESARILVYSPIKIRANKLLLNSVLNPETSSDSPSAKSKGVRLDSASAVMNQMINVSGRARKIHSFVFINKWSENDFIIINGLNRTKIIDTS